MEGQLVHLLAELGLPPAIVGLIVSVVVWAITQRLRQDIQRQQRNIDQHDNDIVDLRERINDVEKEAMQRYVGRDDYLVWMQRIEAKLDHLHRQQKET